MNWLLNTYKITGELHLMDDIPCQDYIYSRHSDGLSIIALADGLTSAKLSHIGAKLACENVVVFLASNFQKMISEKTIENIAKPLMSSVKQQLYHYANKHLIDANELVSTLLFVAHDGHQYISGRLGDGIIGYLKKSKVEILSRDEKEAAIELTDCTLQSDAHKKIDISKGAMSDIDGFILLSDGTMSSLFVNKSKTFIPAMNQFFYLQTALNHMEYQKKLEYNMENDFRKQTYDDCSIAITSKNNYSIEDSSIQLALEYMDQFGCLKCDFYRHYFVAYRLLKTLIFPATKEFMMHKAHLNNAEFYRWIYVLNQNSWLIKTGDLYEFSKHK